MHLNSIERAHNDFQQPVLPANIRAMCHRAFGEDNDVVSAVELGGGRYNTTYRVSLRGMDPVILRIAPEPGKQYRLERHLIRNEHASIPHFAPIKHLMPRTLATDFTRRIIDRDYLFQKLLPGIPASEGLSNYRAEQRKPFWQDLGTILSSIHEVKGVKFGRPAGPQQKSWSEVVISTLTNIREDLEDGGLDADDVRMITEAAEKYREILDEITEPKLLHGDLWMGNVMIDPEAKEPRITGVFDCDRTLWGDPMADWTMFLIERRSSGEQEAFRAGYGGRLESTTNFELRSLFYRARSLGEARLEYHRLHDADQVRATYPAMAGILNTL